MTHYPGGEHGDGKRDAFGRLRVSNPLTLFDSKQLWDSLPLLWDDQETSGTGTGTAHSGAAARTQLSVSADTAGVVEQDLRNAIRLGSTIAGVRDEMVLAVRPLGTNADIQGSLIWRELE